jgi:hypothetical protein
MNPFQELADEAFGGPRSHPDFCTGRTIKCGTLTAYGIGVVVVFTVLNGKAWLAGKPWLCASLHWCGHRR